MSRRLSPPISGFPIIYIAENKEDAEMLENKGIPYIRTTMSDIDIIKCALYPTLKKKFPHINWRKFFGDNICEASQMDVYSPKDYRENSNTFIPNNVVSLQDYCCDIYNYVNIEELANLGVLPKFIGDITNAITSNIVGHITWNEGYNKKLKSSAIGNYNRSYMARNLIILDISHSIPTGIANTMLTLIDTLRTRANADLIITGHTSMYWSIEDELPTAKWIRDNIKQSNESFEFTKILRKHIAGKHWGNVISFGDNDKPLFGNYPNSDIKDDRHWVRKFMAGTTVDKLWSFHTLDSCGLSRVTGYALWAKEIIKNPEDINYNIDWCEMIVK